MRVKGEWLFASVIAWLLAAVLFALSADAFYRHHGWGGVGILLIALGVADKASDFWKRGAR